MIVVFGSINVDLVTVVERLPGPGETVKGRSYEVFPGGKGANQALAARRAGAEVAIVGAVGEDAFAEVALSLLAADGVDLSQVARVSAPTGIAMIAVDAAAENQIVVASGANAAADPAGIPPGLGAGDLLLLQYEVPLDSAVAAARSAKERGARVVLNAAPSGPVPEDLAALLDVLVVNEHEAEEIAGIAGLPAQPEAFARAYHAKYGTAVVVTLGGKGAIAVADAGRAAAAPPPVKVVDTTAAGDTFVGALAAALDRGAPLADALATGVAAGSLAVEALGAQPSIPRAAAIEARLGGVERS